MDQTAAGAAPAVSTSIADISARMDRLPVTRTLWKMVLLLALGGFFEFYDLFLTGYIAPGMIKSGLLTTTSTAFFGFNTIGSFIAATFAGLFVGTAGLSWLPDRFGRRMVFTFALVWYCVATFVLAFQASAEGLFWWRFITGVGIGLEIVTIDTYLTELTPRLARGRAMSFAYAISFTAAPASAGLAAYLVPLTPFGIEGWRWVVMIGATGALIAWWLRRSLPESPRWLAQHGDLARADRILAQMERSIEKDWGKPLSIPNPSVYVVPATPAGLSQLLQRPYRARAVMLTVFNFFQAIGYYGFASWVPTLLVSQGITVTKSLMYSAIIAVALPVGCLIGMFLADRVERKWLIVLSSLAIIICGTWFGMTRDPVALTVLGVCISFGGQLLTIAYHSYQSEVFPTSMRSRAAGLVYSASRIGAMFSGFIIAFLLRDFGATGVFAGITTCMLVVIVSIGGFGPKTNGLQLEEISG